MSRVADSVLDAMIRTWRIACLSSASGLGLPTCNVIGRVMELGPDAVAGSRGYHTDREPIDDAADAETVQRLVEALPDAERACVDAYYIGIIDGKSVRMKVHRQRATLLDISESTYRRRVKRARRLLAEGLFAALTGDGK